MTDPITTPGAGAARPPLRCPLCGGLEFQREEARTDSRWGFTSHRMTLLVCRQCRYVLHFYDAHSIFDID
jgi:hypothetical protein